MREKNYAPHFLVVVSTRNRGSLIIPAIESILNIDYPNFELCVVDQSDSDLTESVLEPFRSNPMFKYIRSSSRGASSGRNVGIFEYAKELIAITDDDCVVPVNWLTEMYQAFNHHPNIGVVGGNTLAGEYDPTAGFIPTYERKEPFLATDPYQADRIGAITACFGVRLDAWKNANHFDEMIGAGAPFRSAEDVDFLYKALLTGYYVYETPQVYVIHKGFRTWREGRPLAKRNWYGLGAVHAKYFKQRNWFILRVIFKVFGIDNIGVFLKNLLVYRRFQGIIPIVSYCQGFATGLVSKLNPITGDFQKPVDQPVFRLPENLWQL